MLKISIVLVTTTAFAALLIAYPFSPHPAAQASGGVALVATATPAKEPRQTPDPAPVGIAGLPVDAAAASAEMGKRLPIASELATGRVDAPTILARTDPARTPDPRIPPRPSRVERQGVKSSAAPSTYPRTEVVARPGAAATRYSAQTSRTPAYLPPGGTLVPHDSVGRLSEPPPQRVNRYRSLALAPDQPVR